MSDKDGKTLLEGAYGLATPEDNLAYYRDFAARYDSDFVLGLGYSYPATVARIYGDLATPEDKPVADIGCGTGLVGAELGGVAVDGMDISPEMLEIARGRGAYRALYEVDLTGDLSALAANYGAVVSAGTFTHGHLGPEVLTALLGLARAGALFVIGVNAAHYRSQGFEAQLGRLQADARIGPVSAVEVPIYDKAGHDHAGDRALVLNWRVA
ncbi:MAG: methyltransferase domain-containing protein [Paracoccaceae bacterium]